MRICGRRVKIADWDLVGDTCGKLAGEDGLCDEHRQY